jgi:ribosomal protein L11 methyltransferase
MDQTWLEIHIKVPADGVDLVAGELMELGCEGVTVEEKALDTFTPPDPDEPARGDLVIKAYFPSAGDPRALEGRITERLTWLAALIPGLDPAPPEIRPVRNEDWAECWKQHFSAVRIGPRLVIKPTWEEFPCRSGDVVVNIDPGMAFGTGTHGTTRLCLEALSGLFEEGEPPKRVLDVGTGSGILAVAAAALGARRVLACDIDADACRISKENARLNGVADRVEVTGQPLESLGGDFDLVLANILAEENIRLAPELLRRLLPGGSLVLSGILLEKEAAVIDVFRQFAVSGPEIRHLDEWSCLVYRKK